MLFGVFTIGPRTRLLSGSRNAAFIAVFGLSTLWLSGCGGTSSASNKNPGTPTGTYKVTVKGSVVGASSVTSSFQFTLNVSAP
jgi:hypothetical protein